VAIILWGGTCIVECDCGEYRAVHLMESNSLPHHVWGALGLVLLLVSFGLQGVQPLINILNGVK
jgi:hypothetical protein